MKLSKHVKESRESLINALKHIDDLENDQQNYAILTINSAIKEIDAITKIVERKQKEDNQQSFFDKLSNREYIGDISVTTSFEDYKLMVLRIEPAMMKGAKIAGYLKTYHLPTTIPDIIEDTGNKHGGGKYQVRIVDGAGRYVKSKTFEISGMPKLPENS